MASVVATIRVRGGGGESGGSRAEPLLNLRYVLRVITHSAYDVAARS